MTFSHLNLRGFSRPSLRTSGWARRGTGEDREIFNCAVIQHINVLTVHRQSNHLIIFYIAAYTAFVQVAKECNKRPFIMVLAEIFGTFVPWR